MKINAKDKKGKITRCIICDSKIHWAKIFPQKSNQSLANVAKSLSKIQDESL